MKQYQAILACSALLLVSGCAVQGRSNSAPQEKIAGDAQDASITEKYWKLTELMGDPVRKTQKEAHMILKAADARVIGTGGCNNFNGNYTLEAPNRIHFSRLASTMMACTEGMDTEYKFHQALEGADSYTLTGDALILHRARMAPFARFEAVYLK